MKQRLIWFSCLFAVLVTGVWFASRHGSEFVKILDISGTDALLLCLLMLCERSVYGIVTMAAANHLGTRLTFRESAYIAWATSYGNFLPMKAGLALQAFYLKHRHDLAYARFASLTIGAYTVQFLIFGVLGVAVSLPMYLEGQCSVAIPAVFAAVGLLCGVPLALPGLGTYPWRGRIHDVVSAAIGGLQELRSDRVVLAKIAIASAVATLIMALRLLVAYRALGYGTPWCVVLLASLASAAVQLASIVPGGLGLREAAIGGLGTAFGDAFQAGVVAATLDRAASMIVIFAIGPFAVHRLLGRSISRALPPVVSGEATPRQR